MSATYSCIRFDDAARRRPALEVLRLRHPRDADAWLARTFAPSIS